MSDKVSLRKVLEELGCLSQLDIAYLNRRTGELHTIREAEREEVDFGGEDYKKPDWVQEIADKIEEIESNPDEWMALPDSLEIHEWRIMERFCGTVDNPRWQDDLFRAIHGRGAFRHFKDTIQRLGIQEDWYRFRDNALKRIAVDWLQAEGIDYTDDDS